MADEVARDTSLRDPFTHFLRLVQFRRVAADERAEEATANMGATRLTHGLPRWLWASIGTVVLGALVATMAVTTSVDPGGPAAEPDEPTARPEIVGGTAAQPGEYPFAVALLRHSIADRFGAQYCGGSLIGPDLVLTAAHCVDGDTAGQIDALVGTHDLLAGGRRIRAERLHIHPAYDRVTAANDVAVVELRSFAEPAHLVSIADPSDVATWAPGTVGTVIGWGSTKTAGYPTALRTVDVPIVSDESCRASYGRAVIEGVMVCAGYDGGGRDSCSGDSGGPLLVPAGADHLQVGVVSWGYGCALPGLPGVYAEVAASRDFLDPYLNGFRDVPAWVDEAVTWITTSGFAEGFPDRRFRPDDTLTRAQAVQVLHRIAGLPEDATIEPAHPFTDVPEWIDQAVRWAVTDPDGDGPADAPMSGYPDGTFRPDRPINRGEFTRLLWRLAGRPAALGHGFSDVGHWVSDAVSWMASEGLATGWGDGTFRPNSSLTRAQASRMLFRIYAEA
jgi:hypothetical protein